MGPLPEWILTALLNIDFFYTKFQKDIIEAPWNILEISDDPNERLDLFEQLFLNLVDLISFC